MYIKLNHANDLLLDRTFPRHWMFTERKCQSKHGGGEFGSFSTRQRLESLFRVLSAFSRYIPKVGYLQSTFYFIFLYCLLIIIMPAMQRGNATAILGTILPVRDY